MWHTKCKSKHHSHESDTPADSPPKEPYSIARCRWLTKGTTMTHLLLGWVLLRNSSLQPAEKHFILEAFQPSEKQLTISVQRFFENPTIRNLFCFKTQSVGQFIPWNISSADNQDSHPDYVAVSADRTRVRQQFGLLWSTAVDVYPPRYRCLLALPDAKRHFRPK